MNEYNNKQDMMIIMMIVIIKNIPMTLIILPRVLGPTGTLIGLPVSSTGYPLTRP